MAPAAARRGRRAPARPRDRGRASRTATPTASARLAALYPASGGTYVVRQAPAGPVLGLPRRLRLRRGEARELRRDGARRSAATSRRGAARPLAAAAVLALGVVNLLGVTKTAALTRVIVAVVIAVARVVVVARVRRAGPPRSAGIGPLGAASPLDVLRAAGLLFFAFAGYARIATLGRGGARAAADDPARDPDRARRRRCALYVAVGVVARSPRSAPDALALSDAPLRTAVEAGTLDGLAPARRRRRRRRLARRAPLAARRRQPHGVRDGVGGRRCRARSPPSTRAGACRTVPRRPSRSRSRRRVAAGVDLGAAIGFSSFCVLVYYAIANASALIAPSPAGSPTALPCSGSAAASCCARDARRQGRARGRRRARSRSSPSVGLRRVRRVESRRGDENRGRAPTRWRERAVRGDARSAAGELHSTISGIENEPLVHAGHGRRRLRARPRLSGRVSVHARRLSVDVPRPAVDDAAVRRVRDGGGDERAVPLPARARADGALDRVRHADADGVRLGPSALARRGRARGSRRRLARRHGDPVRRDPARRGLDVDDDQLAGGDAARVLRLRRRAAGRAARAAAGDGADGHPEGVHRAEGVDLPARAVDAARDRHGRVLRARAAAAGIRSRSRATTSARPARPRRRSSRSRSPTGSRTSRRGSSAASPSTSSRRGCRSSSTRTSTSSRRWRSTAPRGGSGRASCASATARRTRARG